jgi:hypothetical protein
MHRQIKRDIYWNQIRQICISIIQNQPVEQDSALTAALDKIIDVNGIKIEKTASFTDKTKILLSIAEKKVGCFYYPVK